MPTRNRRAFVAQAVKLFQAQDYPNTELVIIDEVDDFQEVAWSAPVVPAKKNITYMCIDTSGSDVPLSVGAKRNLACSLARGEIIAHFDDDDYYGPQRLSKQVEPILRGEAGASAMRMSLLLDARDSTLWTCSDMTHKLCFKQDIHYGTLMFKASYWRNGMYYANDQVGEDRRFVHALLAQDVQIARIVDPASFIYMLHGTNTTSDMRLVHPDGWQQVPLEQYLPEQDRAFYARLRDEVQV